MLWTAKITSRGRVTLPQGLCERMGLQPGGRVTFVLQGETSWIGMGHWKDRTNLKI